MKSKYGLTAILLKEGTSKHFFELTKADYEPFSNVKIKVDDRNFDEIAHKETLEAVRDNLKGLNVTLKRTSQERTPYLEISLSRGSGIEINPYNAEIVEASSKTRRMHTHFSNDPLISGRSVRMYAKNQATLGIQLDDQFPYMLKSMDPDKTGLGARK